jgi:hypothetical protein
MPNDVVTITLRLPRAGLYSRLRGEAERQPDPNGRASVGHVILRRLEDSFAAEAREAEPAGTKSTS